MSETVEQVVCALAKGRVQSRLFYRVAGDRRVPRGCAICGYRLEASDLVFIMRFATQRVLVCHGPCLSREAVEVLKEVERVVAEALGMDALAILVVDKLREIVRTRLLAELYAYWRLVKPIQDLRELTAEGVDTMEQQIKRSL